MIHFSKSSSRYFNFLLKFKNLKDNSSVFIAKKSRITLSTIIGDGTRINGEILIKGSGKVEFGKYCAIGEDVRINSSNHSIKVVNLQYALQRKE